MKGVGSLLGKVVPAMVANAPLTPEKVTFFWGVAVGPAIARASTVRLEQGLLTVRTSDRAWEREVTRSADVILPRVQQLLGRHVVRQLVVESGS